MIRFSLHCPKAHDFDSWFQSAEAFAALQASGHLSCPVCGATGIEKSVMAPAIRPARNAGQGPQKPSLTEPANDMEAAFAEMRRQVEAHSDYVGLNFVAEARRMHEGQIDERAIYGEAKPDEARALLADGVPVAALPFMPKRKAN